MSQAVLETYLARLYSDAALRESFLADPEGAAREAGLGPSDASALKSIDRAGLEMAAASYAHKREQHRRPKKKLHEWLLAWLRG
jgi:hypothetical protein